MAEDNNALTAEGRLKDIKIYFDEESELNDSILRVEDKSLYVNRSVIALASKELASKFALPEGATTGKMEATLEGKKYTDVLDMMTYIYPNFEVFIDRTNVEALVTMSSEYKIDILIKKCAQVMMEILQENQTTHLQLENLETILRYLKLGDMLCLANVRKESMGIISTQFYSRRKRGSSYCTYTDGMAITTAFKALPETLQQEVILNRLLYMEGKN